MSISALVKSDRGLTDNERGLFIGVSLSLEIFFKYYELPRKRNVDIYPSFSSWIKFPIEQSRELTSTRVPCWMWP